MDDPGPGRPGPSSLAGGTVASDGGGSRWRPPLWVEALSGYAWRLVVVVLAGVLVFTAFLAVSVIVVGLLIALLLSTLFVPLCAWLRRHGASRLMAAIVGVVLLLGTGLLAVVLTTRSVVHQWDEISATVERGADEATADGGEALGLDAAAQADLSQELKGVWSTISKVLVEGIVLLLPFGINMLTTLGLSVFIFFFFLKDGEAMGAWLLERVPIDRQLARQLGSDAWSTLSGYFRGVAIVAAVDAVFIGLGVLLIGVPFAGAIAVLTFFAAFIPTLGAIMAGAVACFIALADGGWPEALATLVLVLLVQQLESNILQPVIIGKATKLHPLVVFLAITAGAILAGILGMFLAVPLTAVTVAIISRLRKAGAFA